MSYGHAAYVPSTYFVKAKYHDPRLGRHEEGFADRDRARAVAEALAADNAVQDVVLLTEANREALVRVFKGVEWFCTRDLSIKYGHAWRVIAEDASPETLSMAMAVDAAEEGASGPDRHPPVAA